MIVDSSALPEQVVMDVDASAFDQRRPALLGAARLCVQADMADRVIDMLKGAMAELRSCGPRICTTDIGPVIDAEAKTVLAGHIATLKGQGKRSPRRGCRRGRDGHSSRRSR